MPRYEEEVDEEEKEEEEEEGLLIGLNEVISASSAESLNRNCGEMRSFFFAFMECR